MRQKILLLVIVVLSLFIASSTQSQEHVFLKGLKEIKVVIENLPKEAKQINLTEEEIREDVALKLKSAGIKTVTDKLSPSAQGASLLHVNVNLMEAFEETSPRYFGHMELYLKDIATLERERIRGHVVTWTSGSSFLAGQVNAKQGCRKTIMRLLDSFLSDYKKANPKPAQK